MYKHRPHPGRRRSLCFMLTVLVSKEIPLDAHMLERKVPLLWFVLLPASIILTIVAVGAIHLTFPDWSRFELIVSGGVLYNSFVIILMWSSQSRESCLSRLRQFFIPTWIGVGMVLTFLTSIASVTTIEGLGVLVLLALPVGMSLLVKE
jgi:hypothetical protein